MSLTTVFATHPTASRPQDRRIKEPVATDVYYSATGYRTAREARKNGISAVGRSGQRDMDYDRDVIVQQSRDFCKNNPIYSGIINSAVNYTVGLGHKLQILSDDKAVSDKIESLFNEFWKKPEVSQLRTGAEVEQTVMRELYTCGDTGAIKIKGGLVQLIESEQIAGGTKKEGFDDGILTDARGAVSSFSVCSYKNGYIQKRSGRTVAAQNMIYLANLKRPSDYRGLPPCQEAFPMLHRINDVCDAEAIAWQTLARFVLVIQQESSQDNGFSVSETDTENSDASPITDRITDLGYALMVNGKPGEDVTGIDRNIPGKDFPETIRTFLRLMGLPLGMPLEILFLDWTKSNYSQSRAVLEHAKRVFDTWQKKLQDSFLNVVLEWKVRQWQAEGLLPRDLSYKPTWIGPSFPWLDPLKEAMANSERLERSQTTLHKVNKESGIEYDDYMQTREEEVRRAIEVTKRIKDETGYEGEIPFEIFAGLPCPNKNETKSEVKSETEVKDAE